MIKKLAIKSCMQKEKIICSLLRIKNLLKMQKKKFQNSGLSNISAGKIYLTVVVIILNFKF